MAAVTTPERYRQRAIELAGMAALAMSPVTALEYSRIATRYVRLAAYAERRRAFREKAAGKIALLDPACGIAVEGA